MEEPTLVRTATPPSLKRQKMTHEIDIDNINHENQLKNCCGTTSDKRLLMFIASLTISLIAIAFSCYQLSRKLDCESQSVYIGILTLILGVWVKSPLG